MGTGDAGFGRGSRTCDAMNTGHEVTCDLAADCNTNTPQAHTVTGTPPALVDR